MDSDRNLLFGVLALQADLLDSKQFAEACAAWSGRKETALADLLVERGWLTPADKVDVEKLLTRKLTKHQGNIKASLAEATNEQVRHTVADLFNLEIGQASAGAESAPLRHLLLSTTAEVRESRDRYSLSRLHATGGLGRVWLAHDSSLHRDVALKELRPERVKHPDIWSRFLKEAQVTGQLEHPSIIPVYELSNKEGADSPFYTMRFVRGRTLAETVRLFHSRRVVGEAGTLELRELLTVLVGVCNAVAYAHSRGVIHRDLKPQNVVLGDYGEVMVLDWGLAKVLNLPEPAGEVAAPPMQVEETDTQETMDGQILGTPAYMAPEQAEGRLDLISPATDIYGIGAILYEILTGRPPFTGTETLPLLQEVIHNPPDRPRSVMATTPLALEAICLKALNKKQSGRYASVKLLSQDLLHYLADEPVAVYSEPLAVQASRWMRRHRTSVVATSAAMVVGGICLAVATGFLFSAYREADRQRTLANAQRDKAGKNFQLARSAVDKFTTQVSESEELKAHGLELLRQKLLKSAVEFYQTFVRDEGNEPDLQAEQGRAFKRLADLSRLLEQNDQALASYDSALSIFQRLTALYPNDPSYARNLVDCLYLIGSFHHDTGHFKLAEAPYLQALQLAQGHRSILPHLDYQYDLAKVQHSLARLYRDSNRIALAKPLYDQALTLRRQLVKDHPTVALYQDDLGWTLFNLGNLYSRTRQLDLSESFYSETVAVWKPLAESNLEAPSYSNQVAMALNNLGNLYADTGRHKEAEQAHLRNLEVRQKLGDAHPLIVSYQEDIAKCYSNLGAIYLESGRIELAETEVKKALAIRKRHVDAHPEVLDYAGFQADTECLMGLVFRDRGEPSEALTWYGQANERLNAILKQETSHAESQEFLRVVEIRNAVALCQLGRGQEVRQELKQEPISNTDVAEMNIGRILVGAYSGEFAQSLIQAEDLANDESLTLTARDLFDLACVYALCLKEARSVELLQKAKSAGYFQSSATVNRLKKEASLSVLRGQEPYQELLAELERNEQRP